MYINYIFLVGTTGLSICYRKVHRTLLPNFFSPWLQNSEPHFEPLIIKKTKPHISAALFFGGNNRARTCDPMLVRHVLSQLSYAPEPASALSPQRRVSLYTLERYLSSVISHFFRKISSGPHYTGQRTIFSRETEARAAREGRPDNITALQEAPVHPPA